MRCWLFVLAYVLLTSACYSQSSVTSKAIIGEADMLIRNNKRNEGIKCITEFAQGNLANSNIIIEITAFLESIDANAETIKVYQDALVAITSHKKRQVRIRYIDYLKRLAGKKNVLIKPKSLDDLTRETDPLLAGDAFLLASRFDEAANSYSRVFTDIAKPLAQRLDAWNGLLDAKPEVALQREIAIEVGKLNDADQKSELLTWMGWQLWRAISREVGYQSPTIQVGPQIPYRPIGKVNNWKEECSFLLGGLIRNLTDRKMLYKIEPTQGGRSLRLPMAVSLALTHKYDQAANTIGQQWEYFIEPPAGGWRLPDGNRAPDSDMPRKGYSPRDGELYSITVELLRTLAAYKDPDMAVVVPAIRNALAKEAVTWLQKPGTDARIATENLKALTWVVKDTVIALDPPQDKLPNQPAPQRRPVDMTAFAVIDKAARDAFAANTVAQSTQLFLRDGIFEGMRIASDPKLLDALYDLMVVGLDRYGELLKDPAKAIREAEFLAGKLEAQRRDDLKPYAQRLREKYLAPK
jgi:hypothetical protein